MKTPRLWLIYAFITTIAWGLWGALLSHPVSGEYPDTLIYIVWSLSMIPPGIIAMTLAGWRLEHDAKSVALGLLAGLLGAGGQLVLMQTVPSIAPGYIVFPFIALNPLVTILMAALFSSERVHVWGWVGIVLALIAGAMLNTGDVDADSTVRNIGLLSAGVILIAWGIQGYVISIANRSMKAESIFFYMMLGGLLLAPVARGMIKDENAMQAMGWQGAGVTLLIQSLNSVGALLLVYAYRYGKAMIVAPLTNAGAPAITVILSLTLLAAQTEGKGPSVVAIAGMVLAIIATILMALEEESEATVAQEPSE